MAVVILATKYFIKIISEDIILFLE